MAKRGENIRKRKDGRWEGRYSKGKIDGKTVQGSVFGKTYQETKEKLIKAKILEVEKLKPYEEKHDEVMMDLFVEVAEEWYEACKPTLKLSTISRYRNILDNQLLPEFGSMKMMDITRNDVASFSNRLLMTGGKKAQGLSPKTVTGVLSAMKIIMDYARNVKCMPVIDLKGITVKQSQKQLRVFSCIEQKTVSDCLLKDINLINLGILLCLYTGLRIGEICALTWGDISFTEQIIHVAKTMQRIQFPEDSIQRTKVIITTPKSDCAVRNIPIPDKIFHIVSDMRKPDACFFLTGLEKSFIEPRTLENHFNSIMRTCGIKDATMHTCRHSFATRCVELGFDIKTLSEILGHSSVAITMNCYVHPSMEMKRQNMDKLSRLLGGN